MPGIINQTINFYFAFIYRQLYNWVMGNLRIYLIVFGILGLLLLNCTGTAYIEARKKYSEAKKKKKFISLEKYIDIDTLDQNLSLKIRNQIDPDTSYFNRNIYISFAPRSFRMHFSSCIFCGSEIYIDYKFLNKFDLVFTKEGSDKIIGHIIQTKVVKKPKAKHLYFIFPHQIPADSIDIYGFYNDSLVCKSKFEKFDEP